MIFHASIPADDPERVARVIAELWRREYFPFVLPRTFIVFADDEVGTEVEIAPRGHEIVPAEKQLGLQANPSPSPFNEVHLNIATPLTFDEVQVIARREGWTARICDRGGAFNVIEFWVENKFLLELMTAHELQRYKSVSKTAVWRAMLAKGLPPLDAHSAGVPDS
ncbi:MAG: hypothetical protein WBE37_19095 [Bryobacteraceae bacterium]